MKQLPLKIKNTEIKEKKGPYGAWRLEFCQHYRGILLRICDNTRNGLVEAVASKGERITCREGCTYCCFHYVTVSLAHGIAIVDHLYEKKEKLTLFIQNYEKWYREGHAIADSIDRMRIGASSSAKAVDLVMAETRPLSARYLEMNIQCPFLVGNKCGIYDVRPLSCSGHYSISPPEWCAPDSRNQPVLHNLIPGDDDLLAIMRLADPRLLMYELSLPTMIYKLLTEGASAVIAQIMRQR